MARAIARNRARTYWRRWFCCRPYQRRVAATCILPSMAQSDVRCRSQPRRLASASCGRSRLARPIMPSLSRQQAEEILFEEAQLLDERRYDEWLALLTDDAIYWVPC